MGATVAIVIVVVLVLVIGLGLLIFRLQKRAQEEVPRAVDGEARGDRIVALDAEGRAVTEADDAPAGPRPETAAFERVLGEELDVVHGAEADPQGAGADAPGGPGADEA